MGVSLIDVSLILIDVKKHILNRCFFANIRIKPASFLSWQSLEPYCAGQATAIYRYEQWNHLLNYLKQALVNKA